jgi:hypothetical protein
MRLFDRLAAACIIFAVPGGAALADSGRIRPVDLTPAFGAAWEETKDLPDSERVDAFERNFAPNLPGFYDPKRASPGREERFQARILRGLKQFPEQRAGIEDVSRRFATMFTPALSSFEAQFGTMTGYPPVYLVNSLGEFDGATRELPDGVRLLFGADMIARIHAKHDVQPFFHHELFHLYHNRLHPEECGMMWCSLWFEGLAVYVSEKLNPGATDDELLLNVPTPIRPEVDAHMTEAVCAVRWRLESRDRSDYAALFMTERLTPNLPPRFGYYVGYRVAQRLGRRRSFNELARLPPQEVRPLIERTLRDMAACSAAPGSPEPGPLAD